MTDEQQPDVAEPPARPTAWMMVNPTHLPQSRSLHWEPQNDWHITWLAEPLYDKAALDAAVATERERCAAGALAAAARYRGTKWGKAAECIGDACADAIRGA